MLLVWCAIVYLLLVLVMNNAGLTLAFSSAFSLSPLPKCWDFRHQILLKATPPELKENPTRGIKRHREAEGARTTTSTGTGTGTTTNDGMSPSVPHTPTIAPTTVSITPARAGAGAPASTTTAGAPGPETSNTHALPAHSQAASTSTPTASPALQHQPRLIPLKVSASVNYAEAAVRAIDFYLDNARTKERQHIVQLVNNKDTESTALLRGYACEAMCVYFLLQLDCPILHTSGLKPQFPGLWRVAVVDA